MDNDGWIIEKKGGTLAAYTTSHMSLYEMTPDELASTIAEHETVLAGLKRAAELTSDSGRRAQR